jgi:hypothetical protein
MPSPTSNPYFVSHVDDYRGRIELAAGVDIAIQVFADDDEDFGPGCHAWAQRQDCEHWSRSHTVADAFCNSEIAALDSIAKQLGVFERVNREALTAPVVAGAVKLAEVA